MKLSRSTRRSYRRPALQQQTTSLGMESDHQPFFTTGGQQEKEGDDAFFSPKETEPEEEEVQMKNAEPEEEEVQMKDGDPEEEEIQMMEEEEPQAKTPETEEEEPVQAKCGCAECESRDESQSKAGEGGSLFAPSPDTQLKDESGGKENEGETRHKNCDQDQRKDVDKANSQAKTMAGTAFGKASVVYMLGDLPDAPRTDLDHYEKWFGAWSEKRSKFVMNTFSKISKALSGTVHYDCGCKKDIYAFVRHGGKKKIHLCKLFWSKSGWSGFNSKPGVVIHELGHEVRSSVGDKGYGTSTAKDLAKNKPNKAVRNADNYEYFAESA